MTRGSRLGVRVLVWLHERSLHPSERDAVVGDLLEGYEARTKRDPSAAPRWLLTQTWRSIVPNLHRRFFMSHSIPATAPAAGGRMLNGFSTDLRFAVRLLRRQPLMTVVGVLSLGAGLAFNIVLLTLADVVLVRPLPLRAPHDLALVLSQRETGLNHNFSYPEYRDLRDSARTLNGLVAYTTTEATLAGREGASAIDGEVVSGNFFAALGVPLRAGRGITDADDRAGTAPAVVISERVWRDRLGGGPLTGQILQFNAQAFTVIGVAESRFAGMQIGRRADFWIPLAHFARLSGDDLLSRTTTSWLTLVDAWTPVSRWRPPATSSTRSSAACGPRMAGTSKRWCCGPARGATRCSRSGWSRRS
jgi:hypothetical protein